MGTITLAPYMHQATDATNLVTAEFVILKATTAASGTSSVTAPPHGTGALVYQVNDSSGASTVTIQGSIDGTNWNTLASATGGTVTMAVPPTFVPYVRAVWSGNTGTLGITAAQSR